MSIAATKPTSNRLALCLFVLTIAAACLTGDALRKQRAPDPSYLPEMAAHPVKMLDGRSLVVQRFEVTVADWNRCAEDGACDLTLRAKPDQAPATTPATGLSYIDAQQYVGWINKKTRHNFRLPTIKEWNTMAKAVLPEEPDPMFTDPSLSWAANYLVEGLPPRALKPKGSFSTSPEGVADLDGSVWEWTMDCYDGLANRTAPDRCPAFFVGGEHISVMSFLVRDPARGGCAAGTPPAHLGLRLVSDDPI